MSVKNFIISSIKSLGFVMAYSISMSIITFFTLIKIRQYINFEMIFYIEVSFVIVINTMISLYFLYKNTIKEIIYVLIIGILVIFSLLIVLAFLTILLAIILYIIFSQKVYISSISENIFLLFKDLSVGILYYPMLFNVMLLINLIAVLFVAVMIINLIPRYKLKYQENLKGYYKVLAYSSVCAGGFSYLLYVYR